MIIIPTTRSALTPLHRVAFRSSIQLKPFSSEAPKPKNSKGLVPLTVGAAALGAGYYYKDTLKSFFSSSTSTQSSSNSSAAFKNKDEWIDLKLEKIETINHNTKRFRFALPSQDQVSGLHVASALLTKYQGPKDEKPVIRPYTPVSTVDAKGYIDLLIKKYPNGPMSTHLHDMNVDQRLSFKGPIQKYLMEENKHQRIGMIAGGTGITPMYQVIRHVLSNPNDKTKISLVYGNISEKDILLKRELEELELKHPNFSVFYILDNPPSWWAGGKGYITKDLVAKIMPSPRDGNIKIFVCGPPGLYTSVSGGKKSPTDQGDLTGMLKELGYSKEQVFNIIWMDDAVNSFKVQLLTTLKMESSNFYHRPQKPNRQKARLEPKARRAGEIQAQRDEAEREASTIPNYQKFESIAIKRKVAELGLIEKDINPDGHCLYVAFADQLLSRHGINTTYQALRKEAATYIRSHCVDFLPFLVDENTGETSDIDAYCDEIQDTAVWGGEMEIMALAKSRGVSIHLVQEQGPVMKIEIEGGKDPIRLAYYRHMYGSGAHYNSLRDKH
ncbi:NADH-cytochrome b5 reductase 2 [Neolecta irregularis DAH-3]|uniref:cytochrome-b5 reductase n=1 Tax=Neolecta irregularis (strain DAH-3) TaxID=1198029 RepID=A0A1U7LJ84_NEOID|nr:NADH-cytochrome b5 reductase 2 [Neolecta irregularis DAH-3]|eukprot:OLL22688.1 NADH-cytochrome b5 reductase 2 [Neolecta irregularis DAH-3]